MMMWSMVVLFVLLFDVVDLCVWGGGGGGEGLMA